MNRVRIAVMAILATFALAVVAQEAHHGQAHTMPSVDQHLKMLSEKLDLTADQQAKARPILQEMTDGAQKAMNDQSVSQDDRMKNAHAVMQAADKKLRTILTDEQKTKLDEMEQSQMHADHAKPPQP
jgi:Spy/CpxP family protein refolding chaperone